MNREEIAGLMRGVGVVIKEHVTGALSPVLDRLKALEARQPEKGDVGPVGPPGINGKSVDQAEAVAQLLRMMPLPKNGEDGSNGINGKDGAPGLEGTRGEMGPQGEKGLPGECGPQGEPGPAGASGEKGERGAPGDAGRKGDTGEKGADGVNGRDGASGLNGKDGADGLHGKDADEEAIVRRVLASVDAMVQKAISAMPAPRDGRDGLPGVPGSQGEKGIDGGHGKDGVNGTDGLSLEHFDVESKDGGRLMLFKVKHGEQEFVREVRTAHIIYRGVFKSDQPYEMGDACTYGGSLWIAQKDAPGQPGDGVAWKLAVKKGADAK